MTGFLRAGDAQRVSRSFDKLAACGFRGALAGGLATEVHLLAQGRDTQHHALNDIDFVVEDFASVPPALADRFLTHHVHPNAPEGKTLLQLVDPEQRLRIDLFRQFGATLPRAISLTGIIEPLTVISVEDLIARTTSFVLGRLRRGRSIDPKHAHTLRRIAGLGEPAKLDAAWRDHRQEEVASFDEAAQAAQQLLDRRPALLIRERYSEEVSVCADCRDHGPFQRARPDVIVDILGYW